MKLWPLRVFGGSCPVVAILRHSKIVYAVIRGGSGAVRRRKGKEGGRGRRTVFPAPFWPTMTVRGWRNSRTTSFSGLKLRMPLMSS